MSLAVLAHADWPGMIAALLQVVIIDLTLAGDNAVAVGMAANGLPPDRQKMAIFLGLSGAAAMLCLFALIAVKLLAIIGLVFAGGVLLLWVCWRMWRDLRENAAAAHNPGHAVKAKTLTQALMQILFADLSMSLDNVLAVAGAARAHPMVLVFGLILSIAVTGFAAAAIGRLLKRAPWLGYVGLAIVAFVACHMIWDGALQIKARV